MVNKIVKEILKKIFCLLPLKNIIIFEANPDYTDNAYGFYKYLVEEIHIEKEYELVWYITGGAKQTLCGVPITCIQSNGINFKEKCRTLYYICRAKVIVDCNSFVYKVRKGQIRVHLGHGMPLKMPNEYMAGIGKCDLLTITGEIFRNYYQQFVCDEMIKTLGYPRNDVLLTTTKSRTSKKRIIWMPTYRQHKKAEEQKISSIFPLGIPIVNKEDDLIKINEYLSRRECYLFFRPHPAQDLSIIKIEELSNIIILNDKRIEEMNTTLYEILAKSDGLITDYSSVYYDYLLVNKPIGVTFQDADEYSEKWQLFWGDVRTEVPGVKLDSVEDLLSFIDEIINNVDTTLDERKKFQEKLQLKKVESSPLIWSFIVDKMEKNKIENRSL